MWLPLFNQSKYGENMEKCISFSVLINKEI